MTQKHLILPHPVSSLVMRRRARIVVGLSMLQAQATMAHEALAAVAHTLESLKTRECNEALYNLRIAYILQPVDGLALDSPILHYVLQNGGAFLPQHHFRLALSEHSLNADMTSLLTCSDFSVSTPLSAMPCAVPLPIFSTIHPPPYPAVA
eukprot:CAMPEP_0173107524 /NCGR_PEP_ID=MMETSP1102-20130122/41880_1 /TAXON_ID=49646 /ORGANISM="Geminigera sp., Strain Caron Lab Isolate" /LENGTH=150 /DNA_ID=CAMNT_0014005233 /DNA_START=166 /DNA_END=615 /DNA_ORIENTATION=+